MPFRLKIVTMNQSPVATSIWTWTWLEGPLAGIVQPLVGNKIDICSGPDAESPLVTLWNTPAGFVVQIAGKKVSLNGVCTDVYLLQPGDQLRTKKFAAQIDLVSVPSDEEANCSDWGSPEPLDHCDLTPYLEGTNPDGHEVSDGLSEISSENDLAISDEASALATASASRVSENEPHCDSTKDSVNSNETGKSSQENNQIILAVQALEGIKRQLEQGPDNVSQAILNSIDDICRRLDRTGELVEELTSEAPQAIGAQLVESKAPESETSIAGGIEEGVDDYSEQKTYQKILKRLEEESVDITDLMKDRVEKSITDAELLNFSSLDLACSVSEGVFTSTNTICMDTTVSELPPVIEAVELSQMETDPPATGCQLEADQDQLVKSEENNEVTPIGELNVQESADDFGPSSPGFEPEAQAYPAADYDTPAESEPIVSEFPFEKPFAELGFDVPKKVEPISETESPWVKSDASDFSLGLAPELNQDTYFPANSDTFGNIDGFEHFNAPEQPYSDFPAEPFHEPSSELAIESEFDAPQLDWTGISSESETDDAEDYSTVPPVELKFDEVKENVGGTQDLASAAFLSQFADENLDESDDSFPLQSNDLPSHHTPPPTHTSDSESDVGISDYMSQLFSRLRGGEPVSVAPVSTAAVKTQAKNDPIEPTKIEETPTLLTAEEYVPQKSAPERQKDMNAMRRLANESTRAALKTFNVQKQRAMANARIGGIIGLVGFSAAMFLLSQELGDSISLLGVLSLLVAAGIGSWHFTVLKKLKNLPSAIEIPPQIETPPELETPLSPDQ
jgi:hypothetical protein